MVDTTSRTDRTQSLNGHGSPLDIEPLACLMWCLVFWAGIAYLVALIT